MTNTNIISNQNDFNYNINYSLNDSDKLSQLIRENNQIDWKYL
jgi:hypothetical protein